jgi:hypothetical protein
MRPRPDWLPRVPGADLRREPAVPTTRPSGSRIDLLTLNLFRLSVAKLRRLRANRLMDVPLSTAGF